MIRGVRQGRVRAAGFRCGGIRVIRTAGLHGGDADKGGAAGLIQELLFSFNFRLLALMEPCQPDADLLITLLQGLRETQC